jgi:hypothetical protein
MAADRTAALVAGSTSAHCESCCQQRGLGPAEALDQDGPEATSSRVKIPEIRDARSQEILLSDTNGFAIFIFLDGVPDEQGQESDLLDGATSACDADGYEGGQGNLTVEPILLFTTYLPGLPMDAESP